jgi:hypothetical protein
VGRSVADSINNDLQFKNIETSADYALAQSGFTHLPRNKIMECLTNIRHVLTDSGALCATLFMKHESIEVKNFAYSATEIERMEETADLQAKLYSELAYPHPRGQQVVCLQLT